MYFRNNHQLEILSVKDAYALLREMHADGTLEFQLEYMIKQSDAVKNHATKVEITVFTRSVKKPPILGVSNVGRIDAKELIQNILSDSSSAKSALKSQDEYVLARKTSDVTAFINNEAVRQLATSCSIKNIQGLYRSKIRSFAAGRLIEANDNRPILYKLNIKREELGEKIRQSSNEDPRFLAHDLLLRRGIDPSEVSFITPNLLHSEDAFQGTFQGTQRREVVTSTLQRLKESLTLGPDLLNRPENLASDVENARLIDVITTEPDDELKIPVNVRFTPPDKKLSSKGSIDAFVRFDLLSAKTGTPIYTIIKPLPIAQHVRTFLTPIEPPIVKQANSVVPTRASLEIKQADRTADSVFVYKKNIYTSSVDVDGYSLVGTYRVQGKQSVIAHAERPLYGASIYRCVPAYRGVIGNTFTSVVLRPLKYRPVKAMSLTSKIIDGGVQLEVRNIPPTAVSLQFMQRNKTTFQHEFAPISGPQLVDDVARYADYLSAVSFDVSDGNVYEFTVKAIYRTGLDELLESEIVEYIAPQPGIVDIKITNVSVTHGNEPDVSFNVALNVIENDIDSIKSILERQGIRPYFDDDILRQRDQLKSLLVFSVHRVDEITGEKEYMGVVTGDSFSDREVRKRVSAKPLIYGHKYRYIISALSRTPETALESFVKVSTDLITKKKYAYKPSKFLHPIVLKKGVLVSPAGLRTRYTKSIFEHGVLGSDATVEITFDKESASVIEAAVSDFDGRSHVISWRVLGDVKSIDHFVVMKEVHGVRAVLGCAHNQFPQGNCQWIYRLSSRDRGQARYVIIPMMKDYNRGAEAVTNMITTEGT